jgi:hypothetical protein
MILFGTLAGRIPLRLVLLVLVVSCSILARPVATAMPAWQQLHGTLEAIFQYGHRFSLTLKLKIRLSPSTSSFFTQVIYSVSLLYSILLLEECHRRDPKAMPSCLPEYRTLEVR